MRSKTSAERPMTLREFFENIWQSEHADEVFSAAANVATRAAITAHSAPAGEVEPVAWMYTHPKCTSYWRTQPDEGHAEDGWTETPLYTHPAPPADLVELVEALEYYAHELCELGPYTEACGKLNPDNCGGCRARQTLAKHGGA